MLRQLLHHTAFDEAPGAAPPSLSPDEALGMKKAEAIFGDAAPSGVPAGLQLGEDPKAATPDAAAAMDVQVGGAEVVLLNRTGWGSSSR